VRAPTADLVERLVRAAGFEIDIRLIGADPETDHASRGVARRHHPLEGAAGRDKDRQALPRLRRLRDRMRDEH
jgi:hypothetical protein